MPTLEQLDAIRALKMAIIENRTARLSGDLPPDLAALENERAGLLYERLASAEAAAGLGPPPPPPLPTTTLRGEAAKARARELRNMPGYYGTKHGEEPMSDAQRQVITNELLALDSAPGEPSAA